MNIAALARAPERDIISNKQEFLSTTCNLAIQISKNLNHYEEANTKTKVVTLTLRGLSAPPWQSLIYLRGLL